MASGLSQGGGNVVPAVTFAEHIEPLGGKRVGLFGLDSGTWTAANINASGALLVTGIAGGGGTEFTDGDALTTASAGTLLIGATDISGTARAVITDDDGHLQIDVLSGGGSGTEFTDGDATSTTSLGTLLMGTTTLPGVAVAIVCDADGAVHISDGGNIITVDGTVSVGNFPASQTVDGTVAVSNFPASQTVDGTVSISGTVTVDTELPAAVALADDTANPTVPGVGAFLMGWVGTDWDRVAVEDGGGLHIGAILSVIDSGNSTTTPLGGGGTFTGTGIDVLKYSFITATVFADVDSATDGMTFQFSTDNSNWDDVYLFTLDVSDSDTRRFQFPITAQYFRVVFTNGAGAQSAFRAQTIFHPNSSVTSIHRIEDDTTGDRSATLSKSVLVAKKPDLTYTNIDATAGGNLKVSIEEFDAGALPVECDTELPAAAALADATANPTAPAVGAFPHVFNGTTWDRLESQEDNDSSKTGAMVAPFVFRDAVTLAMDDQLFNDGTAGGSAVAVNSSSVSTENRSVVNVHAIIEQSGNPTTIQFLPQFSNDGGTTWIDYDFGFFQFIGLEDTEVGASTLHKGYQIEALGDDFRIRVVPTGHTVTKTWTISINLQPQSVM